MADTDSGKLNPLKDIYKTIQNSIVLMAWALTAGAVIWLAVWGSRQMNEKDQRAREDVWRERQLSDQALAREAERSRQHGNVTGDWIRKGLDSQGGRISVLTAKVDELIAAVKKLEGVDVGRELLPMPKESRQ